MVMKSKFNSGDGNRRIILTVQTIVLLGILSSEAVIIPSQEQIHRRDTYHTCTSNKECMERLNTSWPQYNFVCCTTIICDENYGDYYLVRSGCTPRQHCAPIVLIREQTQFAARFERRFYNAYDGPTLENNCPKTRQKFSNQNISNELFLEEKPLLTTTITTSSYRAQTTTSISCPCKQRSDCCIHISCIDSSQADSSSYDLQLECIEQCSLVNIRVHSEHDFYFPLQVWDARHIYERQKTAPPTEGTCRGTRYFYDWYTGKTAYEERA